MGRPVFAPYAPAWHRGAPQRDNRQPRIKAANGMQPQGRRQGNEGDKRL